MRYAGFPPFLRREGSIARFLLWLHDLHARQVKSLKSGVLIENTPSWKGVSCVIRDTCIMHPSFVGVAQKVNRAKSIDKKHVFERMPFLLAAIRHLSVDFVARTANGTFYAVMDKKGGASVACDGSSCDGSPHNRCARSSAVRTGRRRCGESASFSAPCKRCTHGLTFDRLI